MQKAQNIFSIPHFVIHHSSAVGMISDYVSGTNWLFEGQILATAPQFKGRMVEKCCVISEQGRIIIFSEDDH
jgi:hypothetical protein